MNDDGVENNDLVEALAQTAASDDACSRRRLYEALLKSRLVVPLTGPPEGPSSGVKPVGAQNAQGETALVGFTDGPTLRLSKPDCEYTATVPAPRIPAL